MPVLYGFDGRSNAKTPADFSSPTQIGYHTSTSGDRILRTEYWVNPDGSAEIREKDEPFKAGNGDDPTCTVETIQQGFWAVSTDFPSGGSHGGEMLVQLTEYEIVDVNRNPVGHWLSRNPMTAAKEIAERWSWPVDRYVSVPEGTDVIVPGTNYESACEHPHSLSARALGKIVQAGRADAASGRRSHRRLFRVVRPTVEGMSALHADGWKFNVEGEMLWTSKKLAWRAAQISEWADVEVQDVTRSYTGSVYD